jgi:hypothetical protein
MKKNYSPTAIVAVLISTTLLTGCIEDGNTTNSPAKGMAVKFSTSIPKTRVYGNTWEPNDQIGVWMLTTGTTDWDDSKTAPLGSNMLYGHSSDEPAEKVVFTGIGEENTLVWPEKGNVDFVAYYPYFSGLESSLYPIDISDQDPQKAIDLMYSDNAANLNISSGNPELSFSHKLTKLVFNVDDAGGTSLEGMTATFTGLPTTAEFDLSTGEMVADSESDVEPLYALLVSTFNADGDESAVNETAIVEAIVLPGSGLDYTLTFTLSNGEKAVFTPQETSVTYEAGKRYIYNISFKPVAEDVEFAEATGELKSIVNWNDVGSENDDPYELPKGDDPEEEDPFSGETWTSGTLEEGSDRYFFTPSAPDLYLFDDGLAVFNGGSVVVSMNTFEYEVYSVTLKIKTLSTFSSGTISSVKVNGTSFVYNDGDSLLENVPLSGSINGKEYTFNSPDGKLFSGDIEIAIANINGRVTLQSFTIN